MIVLISKNTKPKKEKQKKGCPLLAHFAKLGFTNRLALYILLFLAAGLVGGFYLAPEEYFHWVYRRSYVLDSCFYSDRYSSKHCYKPCGR